jgi:hypothetical protein
MTIDLFPFLGRGLADSRDRVAWAQARANRIGASDAAGYAKTDSIDRYIAAKLYSPFNGNSFTAHGNEREPHILAAFNTPQNFTLFASAQNPRHVATPDGFRLGAGGGFLVQCKTTVQKKKVTKAGTFRVPPFLAADGSRHLPPGYVRQMQWELYVCGLPRTLFVWETHDGDGHPLDMEPDSCWVERDDHAILNLIVIADFVLAGMDEAASIGRHEQ